MARAPRSFTVDSWEYPSEGKFGVIVSEPARARDDYETSIMEIELDPDKLIELASDLLALGLRQKKRQIQEATQFELKNGVLEEVQTQAPSSWRQVHDMYQANADLDSIVAVTGLKMKTVRGILNLDR